MSSGRQGGADASLGDDPAGSAGTAVPDCSGGAGAKRRPSAVAAAGEARDARVEDVEARPLQLLVDAAARARLQAHSVHARRLSGDGAQHAQEALPAAQQRRAREAHARRRSGTPPEQQLGACERPESSSPQTAALQQQQQQQQQQRRPLPARLTSAAEAVGVEPARSTGTARRSTLRGVGRTLTGANHQATLNLLG
ncbi:hypothetical protein MNEG_11611, partial [Monoraphidium neglectum]